MAGSPCPIEVMKKVVDKMNMRDIVIVFGQTEASPGCTMTTTTDSSKSASPPLAEHSPEWSAG